MFLRFRLSRSSRKLHLTRDKFRGEVCQRGGTEKEFQSMSNGSEQAGRLAMPTQISDSKDADTKRTRGGADIYKQGCGRLREF